MKKFVSLLLLLSTDVTDGGTAIEFDKEGSLEQ